MRIHIGGISESLAAEPEALESRIAKYGSLNSKIELHRKPAALYYFGYLDMDIQDEQFSALKGALNNIKFRQSQLTIQTAKDPKKVNDNNKKSDPLNPSQMKRIKSHSHDKNVISGRHFSGERLKNQTFRMDNGTRVVKIKCPKTKLWGVERRPLAQMCMAFENGEWRDWEGSTLDVSTKNEHKRNEMLVKSIPETTYLSDSDLDEFMKNEKDHEGEEDDAIEVVPRSDRRVQQDLSGSDDDVPESQAQGSDEVQEIKASEALRGAFALETPFTLFGQAESVPEPKVVHAVAPVRKLGFFFTSANSHFLRTQSQAAKLVSEFDKDEWRAEFFENRGPWRREMKRRTKDVARRRRRR